MGPLQGGGPGPQMGRDQRAGPADPPSTSNMVHPVAITSQRTSVEPGPGQKDHPGIQAADDVGGDDNSDRDAIKVKIVTWNMGDTLPKGDLSVLLGDIPTYTAGPSTGSLPRLPIEDVHPYHLVVVCGQECPTHSNVPRGLGGGIIKGVRGSHRKHKEAEKHKVEDKLKEAVHGLNGVLEEFDPSAGEPRRSSDSQDDVGDGQETEKTPLASGPNQVQSKLLAPSPSVDKSHLHEQKRGQHPQGPKGWSAMLDEHLCGIAAIKQDALPSPSITNSPRLGSSPFTLPSPSPTPTLAVPPPMQRSNSAPAESPLSATTLPMPIHAPNNPPGIPNSIDMAKSYTTTTSDSSLASSPSSEAPIPQSLIKSLSPPSLSLDPRLDISTATNDESFAHSDTDLPTAKARPNLHIPKNETEPIAQSDKCYVHLVKERLMGMYISIYVYRGCEHLVQGVDKDFVTAGLAGGRLGNKGAIGLSVKLADRRFLFVNSHLAAHTKGVDARLANVAKIKNELRVNTFLPKFDTVFWCGDLNFRLDVSRLHAEWLIEQKKYAEALHWDQLRNIMDDPEHTPFPGFQEHTIDFAPTFKYDVWRSAKATNRERRRNMRRQPSTASKHDRDGERLHEVDAQAPLIRELPEVPEGTSDDDESDAQSMASSRAESRNTSIDNGRHLRSAKSIESIASSSMRSAARSDTEGEDDVQERHIDPSAYGSRHKALEVALKSKTKHFLTLCKMDGVFGTSPTSKSKPSLMQRQASAKLRHDFGHGRTASLSSVTSDSPSITTPSQPIPTKTEPNGGYMNGSAQPMAAGPSSWSQKSYLSTDTSEYPRAPLSSSSVSRSVSTSRKGLMRLPSVRRAPSMKSTKSKTYADGGAGAQDDEDDSDDEEDRREGVYDSSKKQRVPSWCDRVLYKSQVIPDPEAEDLPDPQVDSRQMRPFNRLSVALSNFGGRLRLSVPRTNSMEPLQEDRIRTDSAATIQPMLPNGSPASRSAGSPRQHSSSSLGSKSRLPLRTRSSSQNTHPLMDPASFVPSPPADPVITFDPDLSGTPHSISPKTRSRAGSTDSSDVSNHGVHRRRTLMPKRINTIDPELIKRSNSERRTPKRDVSFNRRTQTIDTNDFEKHSVSNVLRRPLTGLVTRSSVAIPPTVVNDEDPNAFIKFFNNLQTLPSWLHRSSAAMPDVTGERELQVDSAGVRHRHQQGEVVCLHYGTIDDAGMRQLEGRSDHRPAIFSAAVYI